QGGDHPARAVAEQVVHELVYRRRGLGHGRVRGPRRVPRGAIRAARSGLHVIDLAHGDARAVLDVRARLADLDRMGVVVGLDDEVAGEDLLGFAVGAVGHLDLLAVGPDQLAALVLEFFAADQAALLGQLARPGAVLLDD